MYKDTLLKKENLFIFGIAFVVYLVTNIIFTFVIDWSGSQNVTIGLLIFSLITVLYIWFINVRLEVGRFTKLTRQNKMKESEYKVQTSLVYKKGFAHETLAGVLVIMNILFFIISAI